MEVLNLNEPEPFGPGNENLKGTMWNLLACKCARGQNGCKSDHVLFQEISLLFHKLHPVWLIEQGHRTALGVEQKRI